MTDSKTINLSGWGLECSNLLSCLSQISKRRIGEKVHLDLRLNQLDRLDSVWKKIAKGNTSLADCVEHISLQRNRLEIFSGPIFPCPLKNLKFLSLCNNSFSSFPQEVFTIEGLEELYIDRNKIENVTLFSLPSSRASSPPNSPSSPFSSPSLSSSPSSSFFSRSKSHESIQTPKRLRIISLRHNQLTQFPFSLLCAVSSLQRLHLDYNSIPSLPEILFSEQAKSVIPHPKLEVLTLRGNKLTELSEHMFDGSPFSFEEEGIRTVAGPLGRSLCHLDLSKNPLRNISKFHESKVVASPPPLRLTPPNSPEMRLLGDDTNERRSEQLEGELNSPQRRPNSPLRSSLDAPMIYFGTPSTLHLLQEDSEWGSMQSQPEVTTIFDLPTDVMFFIFKLLDRDSLSSAGLTCKRWMELSADESLHECELRESVQGHCLVQNKPWSDERLLNLGASLINCPKVVFKRIEQEKVLKSASVRNLFSYLVSSGDDRFRDIFLTTHRSFLKYTEVLLVMKGWYFALIKEEEESDYFSSSSTSLSSSAPSPTPSPSPSPSSPQRPTSPQLNLSKKSSENRLQVVMILNAWVTLSCFPEFDKTAALQLLHFARSQLIVDFPDHPLVLFLVRKIRNMLKQSHSRFFLCCLPEECLPPWKRSRFCSLESARKFHYYQIINDIEETYFKALEAGEQGEKEKEKDEERSVFLSSDLTQGKCVTTSLFEVVEENEEERERDVIIGGVSDERPPEKEFFSPRKSTKKLEYRPKLPSASLIGRVCVWKEIPVIEIARQMCLIDWHYISNIRRYEFGYYGPSVSRHQHTPNILAVTKRFFFLAKWVSTEVILLTSPKERAKLITHFLDIASQLRKFHNFAGLSAIMLGLHMSPISRLSRTFALLSKRASKLHQEFTALTEIDFRKFSAEYRKLDRNTPRVPHVTPFLAFRMKTQDSLHTIFEEDDSGPVVNFSKQEILFDLMEDFFSFKIAPYKFTPVPRVIAMLLHFSPMMGIREQFLISLQLEPRRNTN